MGFTYLTRTADLKFFVEAMLLYAKASSQRVGEWGTNLVITSGARFAREDRIRGFSVNYKPTLLFTPWREKRYASGSGLVRLKISDPSTQHRK